MLYLLSRLSCLPRHLLLLGPELWIQRWQDWPSGSAQVIFGLVYFEATKSSKAVWVMATKGEGLPQPTQRMPQDQCQCKLEHPVFQMLGRGMGRGCRLKTTTPIEIFSLSVFCSHGLPHLDNAQEMSAAGAAVELNSRTHAQYAWGPGFNPHHCKTNKNNKNLLWANEGQTHSIWKEIWKNAERARGPEQKWPIV
jgi:hypothetical protein